jgi:pimeloyl-ACP methyl ester carboxylesterase
VGVDKQAEAVANRIFPHPEQAELRKILKDQINQADPRAYRGAMQALARFNSLPRLKEIHTPTLVITSEEDTTVSPDRQKALANNIPGSIQINIPDANHAVPVEFPEVFNEILLGFLLA